MSNLRIVWAIPSDTATLSASPALVSTLPVTNLQDPTRARIARTTSLAQQQILGNLTSLQIVNSLVLWRHNLSATGCTDGSEFCHSHSTWHAAGECHLAASQEEVCVKIVYFNIHVILIETHISSTVRAGAVYVQQPRIHTFCVKLVFAGRGTSWPSWLPSAGPVH